MVKLYSDESNDTWVLERSLYIMSQNFDRFISMCMDENGKPIAPSFQELMRAKACLPPHCKNAFGLKQK